VKYGIFVVARGWLSSIGRMFGGGDGIELCNGFTTMGQNVSLPSSVTSSPLNVTAETRDRLPVLGIFLLNYSNCLNPFVFRLLGYVSYIWLFIRLVLLRSASDFKFGFGLVLALALVWVFALVLALGIDWHRHWHRHWHQHWLCYVCGLYAQFGLHWIETSSSTESALWDAPLCLVHADFFLEWTVHDVEDWSYDIEFIPGKLNCLFLFIPSNASKLLQIVDYNIEIAPFIIQNAVELKKIVFGCGSKSGKKAVYKWQEAARSSSKQHLESLMPQGAELVIL
ncbi:hypothetical protein Tco_0452345, partial [Tanacetum coccineum]